MEAYQKILISNDKLILFKLSIFSKKDFLQWIIEGDIKVVLIKSGVS